MKRPQLVWPPMPLWWLVIVLTLLTLLALAGLQYLLEYHWLAPLSQQLAQLGQDIGQQRSSAASTPVPRAATQVALEDILAHLPGPSLTQTRIERLHQIASEHGVLVRQASYQELPPTGNLLRHQIQAELAGAYPAIRQFLRALLLADEALAIESLEFSRRSGSGISSSGVRAQLRLMLYLQRLPS